MNTRRTLRSARRGEDRLHEATEPLWDAVRSLGWLQGLDSFCSTLPISGRRHLMHEFWFRQFGWKGLIDHTHRDMALVIDGGLGGVALALARDFSRVCSVYTDPSLLALAKKRARLLGTENIDFVLLRDLSEASFGSETLDLVVVHGAGISSLHADFYQRCATWLQAQGSIFLVLENDRSLPAAFRSVLSLGLDSPLSRLLSVIRSSFAHVDVYRFTSPLGTAAEIFPVSGHVGSIKRSILSKAASVASPAVAIFASKSKDARPLVDEVLEQISKDSGDENMPSPLSVERYLFVNPFGTGLIVRGPDEQRMVVRIPFDDLTRERVCTNHQTVERLQVLPVSISQCAPVPVMAGEVRGQRFYVERVVEGRSAERSGLRKHGPKVAGSAIAWIRDLHLATAHPVKFDDRRTEKLVLPPLTRALSLLSDVSKAEQFEIQQFVTHTVSGRTIPLVLRHGDYSIDNVLFDRKFKVKGVIDWDLAEPEGLPVLDVLYFLLTAETRSGRPGAFDFFAPKFVAHPSEALQQYLDALQIGADLLPMFAVITFLDHVANRLGGAEMCHLLHISAHVTRAVELIRRASQTGEFVGRL